MILILLAIFAYAIYRMAESYNITPWKWITRYVLVFIGSIVPLFVILFSIYGEEKMSDTVTVQKITYSLQPLIMLYQFLLFFFFRLRIIRYVNNLDQIDKNDNNNNNNTPPNNPPKNKDQKDQKDFSYFR
jgi:hypothetical protein